MSDKENVQDQVEEVAESSVEPVQLTIKDLQGLAATIDLASQRGAFKAGELAEVGSYYNKLTGFLTSIAAQEPAPAPKDEAPADE